MWLCKQCVPCLQLMLSMLSLDDALFPAAPWDRASGNEHGEGQGYREPMAASCERACVFHMAATLHHCCSDPSSVPLVEAENGVDKMIRLLDSTAVPELAMHIAGSLASIAKARSLAHNSAIVQTMCGFGEPLGKGTT